MQFAYSFHQDRAFRSGLYKHTCANGRLSFEETDKEMADLDSSVAIGPSGEHRPIESLDCGGRQRQRL